MDDPVVDIHDVILNLTTGSPNEQQRTLESYFTPHASFNHPFCSVTNNRQAILRVFQWYKILSPYIYIHINSVAYDEQTLTLYVNISQTFAIWFIPFHRSPVTLTTVLQLVRGQNLNDTLPKTANPTRSAERIGKYYISSQNDLYQVDQFVRFFAPWGIGTTVITLWHWFATLVCVIGATILQPLQPFFAELSRPLTGPGSEEKEEVNLRSKDMMRAHARAVDEAIERRVDRVKPRRVRGVSEVDSDAEREKLFDGNE